MSDIASGAECPVQRLSSDHLVLYYDRASQPALFVAQGETFVVESHDNYEGLPGSGMDWQKDSGLRRAGVTGPIFVRGASPGSALRIEVLDLVVARKHGVILTIPGRGYFTDQIPPGYTKRVVPIERGVIGFRDDIRLKVVPMIGKIGVAPVGAPIHCSTPGPHGGNLDNRMVTLGATVYLPVQVEGALLSLGDGHAAQGDGESAISGVEAAVTATVRCAVVANLGVANPVVTGGGRTSTVASAPTMEEASRLALADMASLLRRYGGLSHIEAATLISVAADLRVCQIVNAHVTMRVELETRLVPRLDRLGAA